MAVQPGLKSSALVPIGEAAARFGLRPSALRYYENRGLLSPSARVAGRRCYDRGQLRRLAFIRIASQLGMSLDQVAEMLDGPEERWRALVEQQISALTGQIEQASRARQALGHALECPSEHPMTQCPYFIATLDRLIDGQEPETAILTEPLGRQTPEPTRKESVPLSHASRHRLHTPPQCSSRSRIGRRDLCGCGRDRMDAPLVRYSQRMAFADYQTELYEQGLAGHQPQYPIWFSDLEEKASAAMTPKVWGYVGGGAGDEHTQRANREAFDRWGLYPRMGIAPTDRDLSVNLLGVSLPSPVFMAPIGVLGPCVQDGHGDLACAEASVRTGVPFFAGTLSADPMETVAAVLGDTPSFFQLYTPPDREMAASLVHRAEAAGFRGIAVTLDTWVTGWRPRDLRGAHYPQVPATCLANYTSDPVFQSWLQPGEDATQAAVRKLPIFGGPFRWEDLDWLRSETSLPLMLKGICHPEDARRAKDHGADAIYCSNHGGRQANGGLPTLDVLPEVLEAADGLPVLFDSGVRSGTEVIKALAVGATAVGIGRPYIYGLGIGGAEGVVHVLRSILAEADLIMAVDGYPTRKDLTPEALRRVA
jgi:lactate 2-monooxygenase